MLEILIISAVITAKLFGVDRQYAKQGKTPPGYRLIEKWLDGRKARGEAPADAKPAKYGMWRYLWQRWQALWELLEQDHRIKHEQHLRDRAEAKKAGKPKPKKPPFKQRLAGAWQWVIDHINKPDPREPEEIWDAPDPECMRCHTPSAALSGGLCPTCQPARRRAPADSDDPFADVWPERPASDSSDEVCPPRADPPPDDPDGYHTRTEGEPMTTTQQPAQSGEVTGLMSAINYADAVAQAHDAHSQGGGEQYMASLGQAKVGPQTIQSAAAAQEATEIAAGAWRAHAEKLREQLAAKEATTEETGAKEFLLNE